MGWEGESEDKTVGGVGMGGGTETRNVVRRGRVRVDRSGVGGERVGMHRRKSGGG